MLTAQVINLFREKKIIEAEMLIRQKLSEDPYNPELISLMGEVQYHMGDQEEAKKIFLQALRLKPGFAGAHYGLSLVYYDALDYFEALGQAQFACNLQPQVTRYLAQLGLCQIAMKNYSAARDTLRKTVLLDPENVPALNNFGIALQVMGSTKDAHYYFRRALDLDPEYVQAIRNLDLIDKLPQLNVQFDNEAGALDARVTYEVSATTASVDAEISELEEVFAEHPNDLDSAVTLIDLHLKALQLESARDVLKIALANNPDDVRIVVSNARVAHGLGNLIRAKEAYQKVLERSPDHVDALLGLSQVLRDMGKTYDAIGPVSRAAELAPSAHILLQLAYAQSNGCLYDEALETCDRVECLEPGFAPFLISSRAVSHEYLGQFDQALYWVERAQEYAVTLAGFDVFKGLIYLRQENYVKGWDGYRRRALADAANRRMLPYPAWNGEDLHGKTVLVLAEQGLGDQIMFASCLPDLIAVQPKQILLEANSRVEKTLARSFPQIQVIPSGQRNFDWLPPEIEPDYYLHIADLPWFFRRSIADFPDRDHYLLADPERIVYWRQRLGDMRPTVGFSWRGGVQKTRQVVRSLALEQLQPLLSESRVQFVNLQYGDVAEELRKFTDEHGLEILNFPEAIADLDEFAALICALDLVISVCNTTVHYSGALGKSCWVMAPHVPEWRYGLASERMRWYPSVRMFRQPKTGDWESALSCIHSEFLAWLEKRRGSA